MKKINLGQFSISEITYGMWRVANSKNKGGSLYEFLLKLKELDINAIDTAAIYGESYHESEIILGEVFEEYPKLRDDFVIITKCGIEANRVETKHYDTTSEYILREVATSLESLNITSIDVLLLHRPDLFIDFAEVYKAFKVLKDNGLVHEFGVSNFTPTQFRALQKYLSKRGINLVTNQIEVNPYTTEHFDNDNVFFLKGEEISPMIWSPMAGGKLFEINDIAMSISDVAKKYDATISQIAISYISSQGLNPTIILGSQKIKRYEDAIAGLEIKLTREEMYYILQQLTGSDVK